MREVSNATCTSGEPVSPAVRWLDSMTCALLAVLTDIVDGPVSRAFAKPVSIAEKRFANNHQPGASSRERTRRCGRTTPSVQSTRPRKRPCAE